MLQQVGFFTKGEKGYSLEINIPFLSSIELYGLDNSDKKGKGPDILLFYKKSQIGGIWKKEKEINGEKSFFYSGQIFTIAAKENYLKFNVFEKEKDGKSIFVVCVSDGKEDPKKDETPF